MNWEIIATVFGTFGGLELLKWGYNTIAYRKNNSRINEAEADASEFHVLQEQIIFLQQQLKEKEERFAEQTDLVRKLNTELLETEKNLAANSIDYLKRISDLELQLAMVRCDDEDCPFRKPPTAKTPPRPGVTKEEFFSIKNRQIRLANGN